MCGNAMVLPTVQTVKTGILGDMTVPAPFQISVPMAKIMPADWEPHCPMYTEVI